MPNANDNKLVTLADLAEAYTALYNRDVMTGVKGDAESSYRIGNVNLTAANVGAMPSTAVLTPSAAFPIPAYSNTVSYNLAGLTSNHDLIKWNFSSSAENCPPVSLSWNTYAGYFTITNNGGTTSESIKPVFALPNAVEATSH